MQEEEKVLDEDDDKDDDKGLVIDDSHMEEAAPNSDPPKSDSPTDVASPKEKEEVEYNSADEDVTCAEVSHSQVERPPVSAVQKFQHGGLPAASAALSAGPKGNLVSRPQLRLRQQTNPLMNDLMKANLVSSIASALKQTLTTALLEQTKQQGDSMAEAIEEVALPAPSYSDSRCSVSGDMEEEALPAPSYSDSKCSMSGDMEDEALPAPSYSDVKEVDTSSDHVQQESLQPPCGVDAKVCSTGDSQEKKELVASNSANGVSKNLLRQKRKLEAIFGSDDEEVNSSSQPLVANDLEQISDCEEGELEESEMGEQSDQDVPASRNRIVRMLTPPPPLPPPASRGVNDCEEGEIVDKKSAKKKKKKKASEEVDASDSDILRSAGIGGERKVDLSVDEGIPSTFKKPSDSSKTRHYRHQGDIKVVEGHREVKVVEDDAPESDDKRNKRQEMQRYDVRRVIEQRSRDRVPANSSASKSRRRSRSSSRSRHSTKNKNHKDHKDHKSKSSSRRRRSSSFSSTSSSSSSSSSSRSSSSAVRFKKERKKGKENQNKRSGSRSPSESELKRKKKHKSKDRVEERLKEKDKKKAKKKKKNKHKDKKDQEHPDGRDRNDSGAASIGDDIEIPSKAVFATGDKIVVSLHFGSSASSKPVAKKKKRKLEAKVESNKKLKEESAESKDVPEASATLKKIPSAAPPLSSATSTSLPAPTPEHPPTPLKRELAPNPVHKAESIVTEPHCNKETKQKLAVPRREDAMKDGRGRGRRISNPSRIRHRAKPVLIDIETSREIPLEPRPSSDVIVLSDSDDSVGESSGVKLPSIPLPPHPPPPHLPPPPPKPIVDVKTKAKGALSKQGGTGVKFSLASKTPSLKKVNNPLFSMADEEEEESADDEDTSSAQVLKETPVEDPNLPFIPLPDQPPRGTVASPLKMNNNNSASPIFRPPTPPVSAYDPSQPTHTPSTSSTPSLPPSPVPPLPPMPTPMTLMTSFPLPHPGAVLMPPMTSLPPPPLPPPPLLTAPFAVNPSSLLPGVFHPFNPPIMATGLVPVSAMGPAVTSAAAAKTSAPIPSAMRPSAPIASTKSSSAAPTSVAMKTSCAPMNNTPMKTSSSLASSAMKSASALASSAMKSASGSAAPLQTATPNKPGRPMTPPSPTPSEGSDIFGPPSMSPSSPISNHEVSSRSSTSLKPHQPAASSAQNSGSKTGFDSLFQQHQQQQQQHRNQLGYKKDSAKGKSSAPAKAPPPPTAAAAKLGAVVPSTNDGNEECPSSAVELQVKEKVPACIPHSSTIRYLSFIYHLLLSNNYLVFHSLKNYP